MADPTKGVTSGASRMQEQPEQTHDTAPASVADLNNRNEQSDLRTITSRLDHPVTLTYGKSVIIVPPRGVVPNVNPQMLGAVPSGVSLIANTGRK